MLKVILNRLKPQAEETIAEERLGSEPEEAPQNRSLTLEPVSKDPPTSAESVPCLH